MKEGCRRVAWVIGGLHSCSRLTPGRNVVRRVGVFYCTLVFKGGSRGTALLMVTIDHRPAVFWLLHTYRLIAVWQPWPFQLYSFIYMGILICPITAGTKFFYVTSFIMTFSLRGTLMHTVYGKNKHIMTI